MNNNETILKFKEVKKFDIGADNKKVETKPGVKEEILRVIEFKDNVKSKQTDEHSYKAHDPKCEPVTQDSVELTESGVVNGSVTSAIEIPNLEVTRDYVVTDLCDVKEQEPGFTKSPKEKVDISDILARVDAKLSESHGQNYGTINVLFTRSAKDRLAESALLEFRTRGKVYTLAFSITEGAKDGYVKFRVTNTLGKKIFERETRNALLLVQSYFKAINYKVLAEQCLLSAQELTEAATPVLTTIKRYLKKNNCEGLVVINGSSNYSVSLTNDDQFLSRYGTEAAWSSFTELHEFLKTSFPSASISDIDEGTFTFSEIK